MKNIIRKSRVKHQRCTLFESLKRLFFLLLVPTICLLLTGLVVALTILGIDAIFGTQIGATVLSFICNHVPLCVVCITLLFLDAFLVVSCMAIKETVPPITKEDIL